MGVTVSERGDRRSEEQRVVAPVVTAGGSSLEERDRLIAEYYEFVDTLVSRLTRAMGLPVSLREDFIAAGFLGLVEAASRFNTKKGREFRPFAFLRIRGAIIDYIRDSCELSGPSYRLLKALEGAQEAREEELQREVVSPRRRRDRLAPGIDSLAKGAVAFKVVFALDEASLTEGADLITPEEEICRKDMAKKIRRALATLPEKERTVLEQHYFHDKRLGEVTGCLSGLSKSWVSRLHDRALGMLRDKLLEDRIVEEEEAA